MLRRRRKKTNQKDRLKLYEEQANKLRIAWIACRNDLVPDILDAIIQLNRRFEHEDDDYAN